MVLRNGQDERQALTSAAKTVYADAHATDVSWRSLGSVLGVSDGDTLSSGLYRRYHFWQFRLLALLDN